MIWRRSSFPVEAGFNKSSQFQIQALKAYISTETTLMGLFVSIIFSMNLSERYRNNIISQLQINSIPQNLLCRERDYAYMFEMIYTHFLTIIHFLFHFKNAFLLRFNKKRICVEKIYCVLLLYI